jgi:hypothetical protein
MSGVARWVVKELISIFTIQGSIPTNDMGCG